ncbi:MAG: DUF4982 domain-containing protein [Clostridiales bacterium]|nr:DUF4982 domain-containing protein [Clostridiales bacterium]
MKKTKMNDNWCFSLGGGSALESLFGGGSDTKQVTLPHDASIERPRNPEESNGSGNGFFREENYTYTKELALPDNVAGKEIFLEFEGVYQNAFVYVNGVFAGKHPYGYGNFYINATPYLVCGKTNQIKVVVKNGVPSGRWYTGGGIYRDVNLLIGDRLHLVPDQVHLAVTDLEDDLAVIKVDSTIAYSGIGTRDIVLQVQLMDADGEAVAEDRIPITVLEHSERVYSQKIYVKNPKLWNLESPCLYQYRAALLEGDSVVDEEEGTFGIRLLQLDTKYGLRLNGKAVKLRGGCIHHDNGVTGTAEFPHAAEFRVKGLKEAGYNAIRSSHYPMSRRLLEACDRMGMLVMDEFADVWTTTKVDFDYGTHMSEWWERDLKNQVNKDFNHPCVILYSIGNEIPETGNRFDVQWGKKLADKYRELDPGRYVTDSMNLMLSVMGRMDEILPELMREAGSENLAAEDPDGVSGIEGIGENQEINSLMSNLGEQMDRFICCEAVGKMVEEACAQVDIVGYNYAAGRYEKDLLQYPNHILVGSETYPRDLDVNWKLVMENPRVIGDFSWTAWDYLGEAGIGKISYDQEQQGASFYAPYPCKAAYCGDMNLLGDRRPVSYWREIVWGLRKQPYLSVQPPMHYGKRKAMTSWSMTDAIRSWNWSGYEGKPIAVEVYADAQEAALYLNGVLIEKKPIGMEKKFQAVFDMVYAPGTLEVVAYTDGQESGRDQIRTASDEVLLHLQADRETIPCDGSDICYVELSVQDKEGNRNMEAVRQVTVSVDGPGEIQGFGSADPESEENYFDHTAKTYEGRLRAAVRASGSKGTITVTFAAEGMDAQSVKIEANG